MKAFVKRELSGQKQQGERSRLNPGKLKNVYRSVAEQGAIFVIVMFDVKIEICDKNALFYSNIFPFNL